MNVQEITKRLYAIGDAILDKTGEKPWVAPELSIGDGVCSVYLTKAYTPSVVLGYVIGTAKGDTPEAALDAAEAIIAKLPNQERAKLQRHLERVADCVDKARADAIPDEYVTPLSMTVAAMSENLLDGPK